MMEAQQETLETRIDYMAQVLETHKGVDSYIQLYDCMFDDIYQHYSHELKTPETLRKLVLLSQIKYRQEHGM